MINLEKLGEAAEKIRNREVEGLENLYLLTYRDTYSDITSFINDEDEVWNILFEVYIQVWKRALSIPDANIIKLWIRVIIKDLARKRGISQVNDFLNTDSNYGRLEEKAAAVLIDIEEELGIFDIEDDVKPVRKTRKLKRYRAEYTSQDDILFKHRDKNNVEEKSGIIKDTDKTESIQNHNNGSFEDINDFNYEQGKSVSDKDTDSKHTAEIKSKSKYELNIKNRLSVAEKKERKKQRRKNRRKYKDANNIQGDEGSKKYEDKDIESDINATYNTNLEVVRDTELNETIYKKQDLEKGEYVKEENISEPAENEPLDNKFLKNNVSEGNSSEKNLSENIRLENNTVHRLIADNNIIIQEETQEDILQEEILYEKKLNEEILHKKALPDKNLKPQSDNNEEISKNTADKNTDINFIKKYDLGDDIEGNIEKKDIKHTDINQSDINEGKKIESRLENELRHNTILDLENLENVYDEDIDDIYNEEDYGVQFPSFFRLFAAVFATGVAIAIIIYIVDVVKEDESIHTFASDIFEKPSKQWLDISKQLFENRGSSPWIDGIEGKKYMRADGRFMLEEWLEEGGKLYYFDDTSCMVTGKKLIGSQTCTFDDSGVLTSIKLKSVPENKNTAVASVFRDIGAEAFSKNIVMDSVAYGSEWIYFLHIKENDRDSPPELMRINNTSHAVELITDKVDGYIVIGDNIWYSKDGKIQVFAALENGENISEKYHMIINQGLYSLVDGIGRIINPAKGETKIVGGCDYIIENGIISSVRPAPLRSGEKEFRFEASDIYNIYNSDGSVFLNVSGGIGAVCMKDSLLYYSEPFEYNGKIHTKIYRLDINTGKKESVGENIEGEIKNMYYYPEYGEIYAEYAPLGKKSPYTRIIIIGKDNDINIIDETARISGSAKETESLVFVAVEGDNIYCYRNHGSMSEDGNQFIVDASSSFILDKRRRIKIK